MTNAQNMTKRIEFIDALRGFTMLLVVMRHIYGFGFTHYGYQLNSFNEFFALFRMPLFFFISGFILYASTRKWADNQGCKSFLVKKLKIQIIPTVVFALAFVFLFDVDVKEFLRDPSKKGYWFTITLFEFFFLYVCHHVLLRKTPRLSASQKDGILCLFALACYFLCQRQMIAPFGSSILGLLGIENLRFYIFFIFGYFVRKHYGDFVNATDGSKYSAIMVAMFFLLAIPYQKGIFMQIGGGNVLLDSLLRLAIGLLGIMVVFTFFRKYESSVTQATKLGRTLQYIGRRTLDIYLLHYFFLPRSLTFVGEFFKQNENPTLEFALEAFIAAIVIAFCLIVSNVIRTSPFLGHHLFGAKYNTNRP